MFILQTTTAVLIAFLAVIAYNEIRNRLAKGRSRRKDLETPGSPTIPAANDAKPLVDDGTLETSPIIQTYHSIDPELERYKQL